MRYAGWIVSYYNSETKNTIFKGPFCSIDLAQDCAKKFKNQYTSVKIYHLVYENNNQV